MDFGEKTSILDMTEKKKQEKKNYYIHISVENGRREKTKIANLSSINKLLQSFS